MAEQLKPTTGKAIREMREQGVLQLFPSGNLYQVRTVGPAPLLRRGNLPNILLNFVVDAIYNGMNQEKLDGFMALQEKSENALGFLESLRIVCEEVFVSPKVVSNPTADDEIAISDLSLVDQGWALRLAFAPAEALRPFRAEQTADVVSVPELESVPQTTE